MAFVGALTAPGRTTLEISLGNTWFNDRLEAPYQSPPAAGGAGLLLATELAWQGERGALSLALFDGGWLHWSALPRQRMSLDTRPSAWTPTAFWFART